MPDIALPDSIRGEWIWHEGERKAPESHVFFRYEFPLFEMPESAELWITARSLFHLFVNGRYLGFGPTPSASGDADVVHLDVAYALETGNNVIAVLGHNTDISRFSGHRQESGLWAQLNVDGTPTVWTDESWLCLDGECYDTNVPRRSSSEGFCERIRFGAVPLGWCDRGFAEDGWSPPNKHMTLGQAAGRLETRIGGDWDLGYMDEGVTVARGTFGQSREVTTVEWDEQLEESGGGVYMAETFFYATENTDEEMRVFTDDPYILYVNGEELQRQGVTPLPPRADLVSSAPLCFAQTERAPLDCVVHLERGWNRLLFAQHTQPGSAGATFVFPSVRVGAFHFIRKPEETKQAGWSIIGPLRTPLAMVMPQLPLTNLPRSKCHRSSAPAMDESAFLTACAFSPAEDLRYGTPPVSLAAGEYIVVDFGCTLYGCPEISLGGSNEDVVDIVCGEQLVDGHVLSWNDGRRNVDTIVLGAERSYTWTACGSRGLRYMMIAIRSARKAVDIDNCAVRVRSYRHECTGSFSCSDEVYNEIWLTGTRTLLATMQGRFLDAPTKDNTQYVTDSMIQSWAASHVFGAFQMSSSAIREFARTQFETGAMSAVCPSDLFIEIPDYSLMWPVWLHKLYLYCGDKDLIEELLPATDHLLAYYRHFADTETELLVDLDSKCGAYCFLDHGDIDRRGMVTGLNALYCQALLSAAWLHEQTGRKSRSRSLTRRAAQVAKNVRNLTFNPERGLFADGWSQGETSSFYSWQTNVLAIYGGVALPEDCDGILEQIFSDEEPFEPLAQGDTNSPFFKFFVLEIAFALDRRDWAATLMRWYWGGMLEHGATTWWELFDPMSEKGEVPTFSLCHGYGVSPNAFLHTEILGIRPAEPGFTRVYFNPLLGAVSWVKANVPTPYGAISVEWAINEDSVFEASISADFPLEVIPMLESAVAEDAILHVSDNVSILAES
ncbi:MAG: hypothetical protein KAI66_02765 [Lentisphaeria bacterium]|nr:hypothetical protein [Lentisphaeria bacterium]